MADILSLRRIALKLEERSKNKSDPDSEFFGEAARVIRDAVLVLEEKRSRKRR